MASRRSCVRPPSPTYNIVTFRDALGLAFELCATRGPGQYALLSDHRHRGVQLLARPDRRSGEPPVPEALDLVGGTEWASLLSAGGGLLVLSVGEIPPLPIPLERRAAYWRSQASLARRRIVLRDWIHTDGDLYISIGHLLEPLSAWPNDPQSHRRIDRAGSWSRAGPPERKRK